MRDSERIDRVLNKIEKIWKAYPDWRLGQLLVNATGHTGDIHFIEDGDMELALDCLILRLEPEEDEDTFIDSEELNR